MRALRIALGVADDQSQAIERLANELGVGMGVHEVAGNAVEEGERDLGVVGQGEILKARADVLRWAESWKTITVCRHALVASSAAPSARTASRVWAPSTSAKST